MHDGLNSKQSWPDWLPVVALIALAMLIRLPRLPEISTAHDWLTSHTVVVTRIWQMSGPGANHYSLVSNWPNPADRFVPYGTASVFDARGNTYFVSFPPLAFYLSYLFFAAIGQGASLMPLRLLVWIASSLGALALARVVRAAWPATDPRRAKVAATIAAGVFLLSPVSLYSFGVSYFSLILSIPLWMALLAVSLRPSARNWHVAPLSFLLCYMDWLGYLAVAPLALVSIRRRQWLRFTALLAPAAFALILTLFTYASIAGWRALFDSVWEKFLIRSGMAAGSNAYSPLAWGTYLGILRNYALGFAPVVLLLLAAAVVIWRACQRKDWPRLEFLPAQRTLLLCLALPVALDHVFLVNHTAIHRYAVLKAAPLMGLLLAMAIHRVEFVIKPRTILAALTAALGASIMMYYRFPIRTPPEVAAIAQVVQYRVGLDRALFLHRNQPGSGAEPSLLLLTERNFRMADSEDHARRQMEAIGTKKALYLRIVGYRPVKLTAGEIVIP